MAALPDPRCPVGCASRVLVEDKRCTGLSECLGGGHLLYVKLWQVHKVSGRMQLLFWPMTSQRDQEEVRQLWEQPEAREQWFGKGGDVVCVPLEDTGGSPLSLPFNMAALVTFADPPPGPWRTPPGPPCGPPRIAPIAPNQCNLASSMATGAPWPRAGRPRTPSHSAGLPPDTPAHRAGLHVPPRAREGLSDAERAELSAWYHGAQQQVIEDARTPEGIARWWAAWQREIETPIFTREAVRARLMLWSLANSARMFTATPGERDDWHHRLEAVNRASADATAHGDMSWVWPVLKAELHLEHLPWYPVS